MKRNSKKVTVIIPCFNREDYIRETIDSVLSQTYSNIEIIAVDDGSTDGTRKVLESYGTGVTIIEHPGGINKGQSAAINLGMRSTKSEYIAILDSDDFWAHSKIEKQAAFLENHPDVGLVYVNGFAVDERGEELYKLIYPGHVETNSPERTLLTSHFNLPSNSLVRRSAFETAGEFDENMRSSQDHDMAIRLTEVTKLAYLDEPLWYYRRHPASQSGEHVKRRWKTGFKILNNACKRYPYSLGTRLQRFAVLNFRMGQCLMEERKFVQALLRFAIAGLLDPLRSVKVLTGSEKSSGPH